MSGPSAGRPPGRRSMVARHIYRVYRACSHKSPYTSSRQILLSAALKIFALQPAKICSGIRTFVLCEQALGKPPARLAGGFFHKVWSAMPSFRLGLPPDNQSVQRSFLPAFPFKEKWKRSQKALPAASSGRGPGRAGPPPGSPGRPWGFRGG